MRNVTLLIAGIFLALSFNVYAEDFKREKRIYTIETESVIYRIDLAERTALIGGYKYYFGEPRKSNTPPIKLLGGGDGVFEMLYVGMRVKLRFADYGYMRLATKVEQVPAVPGW